MRWIKKISDDGELEMHDIVLGAFILSVFRTTLVTTETWMYGVYEIEGGEIGTGDCGTTDLNEAQGIALNAFCRVMEGYVHKMREIINEAAKLAQQAP